MNIRLIPLYVLIVLVCSAFPDIHSHSPFRQLRMEKTERDSLRRKKSFFVKKLPHTSPNRRNHGGKGSISGTVFKHDGITPNPSFDIEVFDTFGYVVAEEYFSNGTYTISNINPGVYSLRISESDFSNLHYTYYGNKANAWEAQWLTVSAGDSLIDKNIIMVHDGGQTGGPLNVVFTGKAFSGSGTTHPICNGTIHFRIEPVVPGNNSILGVMINDYTIDSMGNYRYSAVYDGYSKGNYYVMVSASPYATNYTTYAMQWWNNTPIYANPVPLYLDGTEKNNDLHFIPGGTIRGIVLDSAGNPFPYWLDLEVIDTLVPYQ